MDVQIEKPNELITKEQEVNHELFLSVIVPMYNEESVIEATYIRLSKVLKESGLHYELIFVNDGSKDETLSIIKKIADTEARVKVINFSRNFGHQIAVSAGIDHALGDAVVLIDADLQDPPEMILPMIQKWQAGYEVVYGKRIKRKGETLFKKLTAKLFYRFLRSMTSVDIPVDTGDFRLMDRKVVDVLKGLREKNRFIRGLVSWVGFKQTYVEYVREERHAGETKYPLKKMLHFALDGITSFSFRPLRFATYGGVFLSLGSFILLLYVLYQRFFTESTQPGWTSITVIILFFNGIIMMMLGLLGEYVGRIYEESKERPLYIVSNKYGFDVEEETARRNTNHNLGLTNLEKASSEVAISMEEKE